MFLLNIVKFTGLRILSVLLVKFSFVTSHVSQIVYCVARTLKSKTTSFFLH